MNAIAQVRAGAVLGSKTGLVARHTCPQDTSKSGSDGFVNVRRGAYVLVKCARD